MWARAQPWISLLVRLGLAAVFLVAGWLKVTDLDAAGRAVIAYEIFPPDVAMVIGTVQPFVELLLGLLLLIGVATRFAAWLSAIAMVIFISGISSAWARGLNIDCGCFSEGGQLETGESANYLSALLPDVAFLAMAIFLIIYPVSRYSLDAWLEPKPVTEESEAP